MVETPEADTESRLRSLGAQADATDSPSQFPVSEPADSQPAPATADKPDTSTEVEGQTPAGDETKPEAKSAEAAAEPTKEPSEYEKAKAAKRDREAEAWKKIEATKAELARKEQAIAEREKTLQSQPTGLKDDRGYTAEDYDRAATEAETAGDKEFAEQFRAEAGKLRAQGFKQQWVSTYDEATEKLGIKDALKDPSSPDGQAFKAVLDSAPNLFFSTPEGARVAAQLFVAQREAAAASALKAKVEALTKENKRLEGLTSIPKSGPTKGANDSGEKDLGESDLRRMAAQLDAEMPA